jgi:hypothetical protein
MRLGGAMQAIICTAAGLICLSISPCVAADMTIDGLKARLKIGSEIAVHLGFNDVTFDAIAFPQETYATREQADADSYSVSRKGKIIAAEYGQGTTANISYFVVMQGNPGEVGINEEVDTSDADHIPWSPAPLEFPSNKGIGGRMTPESSIGGLGWNMSTRFFDGFLDGKKTTLVLFADTFPNWRRGETEIDVFFLEKAGAYGFDLLQRFEVHQEYDDANVALWKEWGVPRSPAWVSCSTSDCR